MTPKDREILRGRAREKSILDVHWLAQDFQVEPEFQKYYQNYLRGGLHRDLHYLENTAVKFAPEKIFEPIGSIAVLPVPYVRRETEENLKKSRWRLSRFAWGRDYHHVIKEQLAQIFTGYEPFRTVVDSTPLPERYLARRAGVGFRGKNSMIIHPKWGSYFFLSFVFLEATLSEKSQAGEPGLPDDPAEDMARFCGECDLCVRACPGGALDGTGLLDCNKCYSYWSIENRDAAIGLTPLPGKSWGNRIYGCDICQEVCPYNRESESHDALGDFAPTPETTSLAGGEIPEVSRRRREGLSAGRGWKNLQRNIRYVTENR